MIKSKKNTQKLYIELKASGKQVDKYFKRLNQYYFLPKTIKVLKAIFEAVDVVNNSTKESDVKLENIINQYIEIDYDSRNLNFSIISDSVVSLMSTKHYGSDEEKEFAMEVLSDRINRSKASIERSNSGEDAKNILAKIK